MNIRAHESQDKDSVLNALSICIDNIEVGVYVTDYYTSEIVFANRKVIPYAGVEDAQTMIGNPCWKFLNFNGTGRCSFCPYEKLIDSSGNPLAPYEWEMYFEPFGKWLKVINQAIFWFDGRLAQMVTFYDITETKQMQDRLYNLAFKDRLLGLKNEISIEKDILDISEKPSMLIVDILNLQRINEAYDRDFGDRLLCAISEWILAQNTPNSELYRLNGDEFCLAAKNIEKNSLMEIAKALYDRFAKPWTLECNGNSLQIFCSASIAVILSEYIQDSEPLLNLIERTLKVAKEKKTLVVYDKKMDDDYRDRLRLELSLKRCVRESMDGFDVYFQPIIDTASKTWIGLEALCRWNSPELGFVPPLTFIPEAERLELIGTLGLWVLETAIRNCKKWSLDKNKDFILHINMSAVQFLDSTLADKVLNIIDAHDYPGGLLCLEITESTQFTFSDQSLATIERLKEHDIVVALDDFGTGYSSFESLKSLPVDVLKIERIFVADIETDAYHQNLFRAIAEIAHAAGKSLVVEGVEFAGQMDILAENGADFMQGYLFSQPIPAEMIEAQLHRFIS